MVKRSLVVFFAICSCRLDAAGAEPAFVFKDVAEEVGLLGPLKGMMGHAAAWGDVNQDGWPDLFVGTFADRKHDEYRAGGATGPVPNVLMINNKGRFVSSGQTSVAWKGRASGSVWGDLDNDGYPELYVANNGRMGHENQLYHNERGTLKEIAGRAGAPMQLPETARSATFLDFDGDGLLDVLVLAGIKKGPSKLFRNKGKMQFEESDALPADLIGLGVATGDLTGNGWPDIMVGGPNRMFLNDRGTFREAKELNMDWGFEAEDRAPSCGVAFGDVDRDGDLDILVGAHTKQPWREPVRLRLLLNNGSTLAAARFSDVSEKMGLDLLPMRHPHVEMRDFNNDGWLDLYTSIAVFKEKRVYPVIFQNLGLDARGLPKFKETAFVHQPKFPEEDDLPVGKRSAVFYERLVANRKVMYYAPGPSSDFNRDGRLDIFLASWFPQSPSLLLKNETESGGYLRVSIEGGTGMNRMGIGSFVRAYEPGRAGVPRALVASEQISTASGYTSGQLPLAHLGLGDLKRCDLVITWPYGRGELVRKNVSANQEIRIKAE